jgi:hypothetical protein
VVLGKGTSLEKNWLTKIPSSHVSKENRINSHQAWHRQDPQNQSNGQDNKPSVHKPLCCGIAFSRALSSAILAPQELGPHTHHVVPRDNRHGLVWLMSSFDPYKLLPSSKVIVHLQSPWVAMSLLVVVSRPSPRSSLGVRGTPLGKNIGSG